MLSMGPRTEFRLELVMAAGLTILSVWSHATVDYYDGPAPGRHAVLAVFLVTLAYAGFMLWRTAPNPVGIWSSWSPSAVATAVAIGCLFLLVGIHRLPSWSEEAYWIELGRNALHWGHYHPIWFKEDFPSSFQAWPITALLAIGVPPILASRIPTLIYMVMTALIIAATTRFFVPKPSLALGMVFPIASLWMVFIIQVGWSDVGSIPLMIAMMTYFLAASVLEASPRNHLCLAVATAVGCATLYMPMLYGLVMLAIFAVLPRRIAGMDDKLRFAAVFSVLISSTVGKAIQSPSRALGRHLAFIEQGREWTGTSVSLHARVAEIGCNLREALTLMLPDTKPAGWWDLLFGWIEPTTFIFFLIGVATMWIGLRRAQLIVLIVPPLLLILGVSIADPRPSPWRLTVLTPMLFLLASIGAGRVVQLVSKLGRFDLRLATVGVIITIHLAVFLPPWLRFMEHHYDSNGVGDIAATIAREYKDELADLAVVSESGIVSRMIQNLTDTRIRYRQYASPEDLKTAIGECGDEGFLVITVDRGRESSRLDDIGLDEIRTRGFDVRRETVYGKVRPRWMATILIVDPAPERPSTAGAH